MSSDPGGSGRGRGDAGLASAAFEILYETLDQPISARRAFLAERCDDDARLRREVESLLEAHDRAGAFLETPVLDGPSRQLTDFRASSFVGLRIGPFHVLDVIAAGGMGVVLLAEQEQPRRKVALKILHPGLVSEEALRRFDHESAILARLQHPAIAQVYGAGAHDDPAIGSLPYFAMEYIEHAAPVTDYAAQHGLSTEDRLRLVLSVCDGVQHGHQKGIIHRDLKPANILVDEARRPKIIDFGVARLIDDENESMALTRASAVVGTVAYMCPEQLDRPAGSEEHHDTVDVRVDVYALGVVMYELLTGRRPFGHEDSSLVGLARDVVESAPLRPGQLNPVLRGDVETIILKAMARERDQRYSSAWALADDIRRYLAHEPIVARPPTVMYRTRKFVRRNRALVSGLAMTFLALAAGIIVTGRALSSEAAQRHLAEESRAAEAKLRTEAEQREAENLRIAKFQAAMLRDVDLVSMGEDLRRGMRDELKHALAREGVDDATRDEQLAAFDQLIRDANMTNVALESIDQHVLARALHSAEVDLADQPQVRAALLHSIADTYATLGLLSKAVATAEAALELRQSVLGEAHVETLDTTNMLATMLADLGRYEEAERYARRVLELRRDLLGEDDVKTLNAHNNVGFLLQQLGRFAEAEEHFRVTLEAFRAEYGEDDPKTLNAMNNLAFSLRKQDRPAEAEPLFRRALEGRRRVLGEHDPETLMTASNLAALLYAQGRFVEAEPLFRESWEAARFLHGDRHPTTLTLLNNYAVMLTKVGRFEDAEPLRWEVLEGRREALGDDHPNTIQAMSNMGVHLASQQKYDEGIKWLQRAFDGYARTVGEAHPRAITTRNLLGYTLTKVGRLDEATAHLHAALAHALERLGPRHQMVSLIRRNLGQALFLQDRFEAAERELRESFAILDASDATPSQRRREVIERFVALYEAWHAHSPGAGHDVTAAEWQARLDALGDVAAVTDAEES